MPDDDDGRLRAPAARACGSCPYRRDVPAGLWAAEEYAKLPRYDAETGRQPLGVFRCHQGDGRVCAGWAGCHDTENLLALRIAAARGVLSPQVLAAVLAYRSPVPLFATGAQAAAHGLSGVSAPDARARRVADRLVRRHGIDADGNLLRQNPRGTP
jgi:hypothetical protein